MNIRRIVMNREEFEKVVDYYDREGFMHPNDIDKLIELAASSFGCCEEECQEDTQLEIT